ncbi:hypothetical protein S40285_08395 [Stachybotrys chlorohalonatus IBT 40285]|uniref:Fascin domain-containing protein n=1 Tax=Stachybotrys chlorohalonatus (strain IBT 40285) TaxID=1283841 RepID=A0A084QCP3_STAC4|nr:hypothetical protein S40285_08395 [Stachybotrys chlorohalonata IBT 40285]
MTERERFRDWLNSPESSISSGRSFNTPSRDSTVHGTYPRDPGQGPLLPGKTFKIIERKSGRPITLQGNSLSLATATSQGGSAATDEWLCVERNGYLGLQDPSSGKYLGHNGKSGVHALATEHKGWECLTTRDHPSGGYWLMTPDGADALRVITVGEDGKTLVTRQHGKTLWAFVEVSDP